MSIVRREECEKTIDTDFEDAKDVYIIGGYYWLCNHCYEENNWVWLALHEIVYVGQITHDEPAYLVLGQRSVCSHDMPQYINRMN